MVRNIELSELSFPFDIQMTGNLGYRETYYRIVFP